jgi:hypothetical protein
VGGEEPGGGDLLKLGNRVLELAVGHLEEGHEVLWVAGEKRVSVVAGGGMEEAVGDGEGEGLEPGGAALWVRDKEDVVGARLELLLHQLDALHGPRPQPAALVKYPESFRLWSKALVSDAVMVALALRIGHGGEQLCIELNWGWCL